MSSPAKYQANYAYDAPGNDWAASHLAALTDSAPGSWMLWGRVLQPSSLAEGVTVS